MNKEANASAKSQELQPNPQAKTIAAHLILPKRNIILNNIFTNN
jgi:hypothetical protein